MTNLTDYMEQGYKPKIMTINDCRIIDFPKFLDPRGNLSFAENFAQIPFEIRRCYWIYDVPGGEKRDGHAYREKQEFIIAMSGALDVVVSDGKKSKTFTLNRLYHGLLSRNDFK